MRAVFHLVGECRELGDDPRAWRSHLLDRLCKHLGARVGVLGEATGAEQGLFVPVQTVDHGWESGAERQAMFEWMEYQASSGKPRGLVPLSTCSRATVARSDVLPDKHWYDSAQFNEFLRRSNVDDLVVSFERISGRSVGTKQLYSCLTLFRAPGERKFRRHAVRFVELLHEEMAPLVGRRLAAAQERAPSSLSPRKREVLECLLEGDTDMQIARRLRISKPTVSEYVTEIFRYFGVSSRAELLARFLRRFRRNR